MVAIAVALIVDVANQLVFFSGWSAAFRSWVVTLFVAPAIAIPILTSIGRAHLALYRSKVQMETLSRTDPLTGLRNRRALFEEAEQAGATLMVLAIIDIDHFKRVNDTHGHRVGDAVLRSVGQAMEAALKEFGLVGRLGGEEFALISRHRSPEEVLRRLGQLRDQLAAGPLRVEDQEVLVTISAGVALRERRTLDELYSEADKALYRAKRSGRNRICVADELADGLQPPSTEAPPAAGAVMRQVARAI